MILTGKQLTKLKEEYARSVVEHMTQRETHSYLIQVMYNEVSVIDGEDLKAKIIKVFGQDVYDKMVEEITTK